MNLRIVNALIVSDGRCVEGDVRVRGDRIAAVGAALPALADERTIDARGRLLLPGMIDDQVHFREPGLMHKGDIATESRAAVAGGITSYMEMPNTSPQTTTQAAIHEKLARAKGRSHANFAFYLGATNDNVDDIRGIDPRSVCGVKVFMGASTGNMLVDDPRTLEAIFSSTQLVIATHCEDTPTILANEARARAEFGDEVPISEHPRIRSEEACYLSSSMAVGLARKHGARLHVLHLTTAKELALFTPGPLRGKQITAEVCAHHLFFNESAYATKGTLVKCNPAIKRAADQQALIEALAEDRIDIVATDHAPHTREEKARGYFQAPSGLPLVQHALVSVLELWHAGRLTLPQVVEKTAHASAIRFDVRDRGFIREGAFADLVLVDADARSDPAHEPILYKCGWTPFAGSVFRSRVDATIVNGEFAYEAGLPTGSPTGSPAGSPNGRALEFDR